MQARSRHGCKTQPAKLAEAYSPSDIFRSLNGQEDSMKFCKGLVIFISVATILAFAGLIPLGTWQDDFLYLQNYHQQGVGFLVDRLLHWSPRPLSETLIYFYALAVHHYDAPLIWLFVGSFWLVLIGAILLPPLLGRRGNFAAIVLLATLFLGHPVTEFFYWPDGTAAYLPTLAAAAMLLTLDWGGWSRSRGGVVWTFIALMIAAASFEVGAMFAIIYIGLRFAGRTVSDKRQTALLLLPLLLSLAVLYFQYRGRVVQASEVIGDPAVAHHPFATLLAAVTQLPIELLRDATLRHKYVGFAVGLLTKAFFFVGFYLAMSARSISPDRRAQRMRLILAVASLATAVLTMAASLYNFGTLCCERHATLQQNYVLIALASLATLLAARWPSRHHKFASPALLLALMIPLAAVVPRLVTEYRNYGAIAKARDETWRSGRASGPAMKVTQTAPNLSGNLFITPGIYHRSVDPGTDARAQWMLIFFDKQSAEFTPAIDSKVGRSSKGAPSVQ
jgi:hypothetical protein